ncbi:hypothetical protein AABB24_017481, partial [Solanum stoloniferum]
VPNGKQTATSRLVNETTVLCDFLSSSSRPSLLVQWQQARVSPIFLFRNGEKMGEKYVSPKMVKQVFGFLNFLDGLWTRIFVRFPPIFALISWLYTFGVVHCKREEDFEKKGVRKRVGFLLGKNTKGGFFFLELESFN